MTRNKVVPVPFPFDDLSSAKLRPAVCLTDPIGPHRHVVMAFITSRVPAQPLSTDLVLSLDDVDFGTLGLRVSSTLQLHRLVTLATHVIRRELGELSPPQQREIARRLRSLFDLG